MNLKEYDEALKYLTVRAVEHPALPALVCEGQDMPSRTPQVANQLSPHDATYAQLGKCYILMNDFDKAIAVSAGTSCRSRAIARR